MNLLANLQTYIVLGLSAVAFGVEVWAFVDCLRRRPDAFVAAGKRTKQFWMLLTGVAVLLGFIGIGRGLLVSLLSGSQLSVSGPAAGLSTVVAAAVLSAGSFSSVFICCFR